MINLTALRTALADLHEVATLLRLAKFMPTCTDQASTKQPSKLVYTAGAAVEETYQRILDALGPGVL